MTFLKANPAFCLHTIVPLPIIVKLSLFVRTFVVIFSSNTKVPLLILSLEHKKDAFVIVPLLLIIHGSLDAVYAMDNLIISTSDEI